MLLNKEMLGKMFKSAAKLFKENATYLCEIDSKYGDGDHGITISKIADVFNGEIVNLETETIYDFLDGLSGKIMAVNGGSAGPLYGTLIGGLAIPTEGKEEIDPETLKAMLKSCLDEMKEISTAKIGDKTMMDALIPAVEAGLEAENSIKDILIAAAQGASQGAEETKNFVAKYGRAKSYKEKTLGTKDAGATSTALLFQGFANIE